MIVAYFKENQINLKYFECLLLVLITRYNGFNDTIRADSYKQAKIGTEDWTHLRDLLPDISKASLEDASQMVGPQILSKAFLTVIILGNMYSFQWREEGTFKGMKEVLIDDKDIVEFFCDLKTNLFMSKAMINYLSANDY